MFDLMFEFPYNLYYDSDSYHRQSSGAVAALAEIVLFLQFLNVLFRPQGLFSR